MGKSLERCTQDMCEQKDGKEPFKFYFMRFFITYILYNMHALFFLIAQF